MTGLGHRRVLYLAGPSASDSNAARLQGIEEYRSRRDDLEVTVLPGGTSLSDGRAAAPAVVSSGVTAVVCFNDLVALGLLSALDEQGVDVPGEISVAGFDDVPFAAYSHPPLTSVALDFAGNGARAWQRLALTTPAGVTPVVPEPAEPRLVVRASTGPAA
nr:substrate-binding domain-containing protein [Auraticoccus cholistanensis]